MLKITAISLSLSDGETIFMNNIQTLFKNIAEKRIIVTYSYLTSSGISISF